MPVPLRCTVFAILLVWVSAGRAQYGYLKIDLGAEDVRISVDGRTPAGAGGGRIFSMQLPAGRHTLRFTRPGFRPHLEEVQIEADRLLYLHVKFEARRPKFAQAKREAEIVLERAVAHFVVVSFPPDLPVAINDSIRGNTPLKVENFPAGPVKIGIRNVERSFRLEAGRFRRFKYQNGRLYDATVEKVSQVGGSVELEEAKLVVEYAPKLRVDWGRLTRAAPQFNFSAGREPMYLLCVLFFDNRSQEPVSFDRVVKVFREDRLVETARFPTRVAAGMTRQGWYNYVRRKWSPGFYRVEVWHESGRKLADIAFHIEK